MSKTIIFYDPSFPISGDLLSEQIVASLALTGRLANASELASMLLEEEPDCFINLHAPYFPKAAWNSIIACLKQGCGFISAGGAPFKYPVRLDKQGQWEIEAEQTAYHQELGIHEALRVDASSVQALVALTDVPLMDEYSHMFKAQENTWNLVPHVTKSSDLPHQMGSAGPMDARIYPLLKGISTEGRELSAPVVLWERLLGEFAGARWLFVGQPLTNLFWEAGGADAIAVWSRFVACGVTEWHLKSDYAAYEPGERPMLTLQMQRLGMQAAKAGEQEQKWQMILTITKDGKPDPVYSHAQVTEPKREMNLLRFSIPLAVESGYYHVEARLVSEAGEIRVLRQGFWGRDEALLSDGSPVKAGRDYFIKDGKPLPVVGMTYMASDVARKFLTLPNVSVWERDMAQMKKAGINWIRTGIWTAYRNIMEVDGHASEAALRAIDAFLLTAKRHELQVTFTFFSFTPEAWEGRNPYLDPRSLEAQKRFVRSIVSRHQYTTNVDWDLINEPSMFDPPRIFSEGPRSCRDPFEQKAFSAWLKQRHGSIELLQEKWNMTPGQLPSFEDAFPPEPEEINFDVQDMHQAKKGGKWLDYVLFSMDMHNRWASILYAAIKELCPNQLVAVGQDEALGAQRPSPFFYEQTVDYTTVHSWWLNDHLLWDSVFSKTPHKPNLVQETGIMYVETPDGLAKRSETELRNILERKYAYAFSSGGAGAIQWIWNTNFYMDNANESHIGALRADGTEKPEADVSYHFGTFINEISGLFEGRTLEETVVVFPYTNDFSNRKLAFEATTKATRVLGYQLKIPFRAIGEYQLEELRNEPAKLIIVPSPHNFDTDAYCKLMEIVAETGATLLWSGPVSLDAYWRPTDRAASIFGPMLQLQNVRREEQLLLGSGNDAAANTLSVSYGARKIAELAKEVIESTHEQSRYVGDELHEVRFNSGSMLWSPQPVELNDRMEAIEKLYRYAAEKAEVNEKMIWNKGGELPGVFGEKLILSNGALYIFVSECSFDASITVEDPVTGTQYSFELQSDRAVLFAADSEGSLLAVYRPEEVSVQVQQRSALG